MGNVIPVPQPAKVPDPPRGMGNEGRKLWRAVLRDYELNEHEVLLLRQACLTADTCATLHGLVESEGHLLESGKANPALVELRQQRIVLARLLVALRVPT